MNNGTKNDFFIIVNRNSLTEAIKKTSIKRYGIKDIQKNYKGFDGLSWSIFNEEEQELVFRDALNLLDKEYMIRIFNQLKKNYFNNKLELLFIRDSKNTLTPAFDIQNEFIFCGYDYGVCDSVWNAYSIILNEVIFGTYESLVSINSRLNNYLLLPEIELVMGLQKERRKVIDSGGKLEEFDEIEDVISAFTVYLYRSK